MTRILLSMLMTSITLTNICAQSRYRTSLEDYYMSQSIGGNRFLKRLCIAGGMHFIPGNVALTFNGLVDSVTVNKDYSVKIKNKQSYAAAIGVYFPIKSITDNSMLVFNIDFMAAYNKLQFDSLGITGKKSIQLSAETYRVGIPVSIEYHSGGDVLLNKSAKSMFSLGAGIMPGYIYSNDNDFQSPIIFTPFVKAELGFFALVGMKLRGTYYIGHVNYSYSQDYDLLNSKNVVTSEFKGGSGFTLSLVVLPFSVLWNKD